MGVVVRRHGLIENIIGSHVSFAVTREGVPGFRSHWNAEFKLAELLW